VHGTAGGAGASTGSALDAHLYVRIAGGT
jgi:hypothetical protein